MVIYAVGFGAGIGAVMRYAITLIGKQYWTKWPWATFVINVAGALLAGFLTGMAAGGTVALFLLTGLCGGFTTFSTFTTDTFVLVRNNRWLAAVTYYIVTIIFGIIAIEVGWWLGSMV